MTKFTPRVFSGVQPTGNLHLGNYLGAIKKFVPLQENFECLYCVVDLHAITANPNPEILGQNTREVAAAYLAAGIDPKNHIIFNQSSVPQHAELAWFFNCVARMGWLNRMTQFKEKAGKNKENASVGLYSYPNLMAADILLYKATHVPVGDDQKQHLELTRDIAQKFNIDFIKHIEENGFGDQYFPLPEPIISGAATRVMSLRDGAKKMSKSDPSDYSRITMTDDADKIALKIRKAKTDPEPLPETIEGFEGRAEAKNLVGIYSALSGKTNEDVLEEFGGETFATFKKALTDLAVPTLEPITKKMQDYMDDQAQIDQILKEGGEKARAIAEETMKDVKTIFGMLNP